MPGAGEISLTNPNFKCRRKWIKQYQMSLQQNLLFYQRYTLSHLSWNPAMEGHSQSLCMFLGFHQKAPMSPHKFKLFAYYSRTTGLSGSSWSVRCREEPTQGCRTHSVPIRAWGLPETLQGTLKTLLWSCHCPLATHCKLFQCPQADFPMDPAQTLPAQIHQQQTASDGLSPVKPLHPDPWPFLSDGTESKHRAHPAISFHKEWNSSRGPGIHHGSHSSFWSTDRKAY